MYEIEKSIPFEHDYKFPFRQMDVGDSFVAPLTDKASAYSCAKLAGVKIKAKTITDTEMRVWRIK